MKKDHALFSMRQSVDHPARAWIVTLADIG
jgi:hypothetical protein